MKLPEAWLRFGRDSRIFGSALVLVLAFVIAWLIAPGDDRLFNFLLLFSTLGALSVATLNIWITRWEALRKPAILIGIEHPGNFSYQIQPKWAPDRDLSEPVSLRVAMRNAGSRSAGQVLYNVELPKEVKNAMGSFRGICLADPAAPGSLRYVYSTRNLQPGPVNIQQIEVAFPRGSGDYIGCFILHVDEDPEYRHEFVIEVREGQTSPKEDVV